MVGFCKLILEDFRLEEIHKLLPGEFFMSLSGVPLLEWEGEGAGVLQMVKAMRD